MNSAPGPPPQFDFGQNWEDFFRNVLDAEKVRQAKEDFQRLLNGIPLENRSFLDIGFGQGLSLLSAASGGAWCLGIDINARCLQVLSQNGKAFFPDIPDQIERLQRSILDPELIRKLKLDSHAKEKKFDIVHSWGSPSPYWIDVPSDKNRGMDFYHDVINWVGGYPYEYANRAEITDYLKELGFDLIYFFPPTAPTGCMEFVFRES